LILPREAEEREQDEVERERNGQKRDDERKHQPARLTARRGLA
jgi:hypothetical protein